MKYLQKSFSVSYGGKAYSAGWEQTFGKSKDNPSEYNSYFSRLEELISLSDGWLDKKDGGTISLNAQFSATLIGSILKQFEVSVPFLYPGFSGGLSLEWDKPSGTAAYIHSGGDIWWFFIDANDNDAELVTFDVNSKNIIEALYQVGLLKDG